MNRSLLFATCAWLATSLLGGCGGGATAVRPTSPFTDEDARFFDGSVDFVEDPTALQGRWADTWNEELDERVGRLDMLAAIEVHTLRTDTDLDRRRTFRLVANVRDELYGDYELGELDLVVREGERGFATVEGNQRRILHQPFLAFVKFAESELDGSIVPKWHLSPVSQPVLDRVNALLEQREPGSVEIDGSRRRVVYN